MTTAAIYARVSSARQREEQTIGSQTAALIEAAERWGLEVPADWVFEDEGYSGATLIRPPSSASETSPPRSPSTSSSATRPTAWPGATPTRLCSSTSSPGPAPRSGS